MNGGKKFRKGNLFLLHFLCAKISSHKDIYTIFKTRSLKSQNPIKGTEQI